MEYSIVFMRSCIRVPEIRRAMVTGLRLFCMVVFVIVVWREDSALLSLERSLKTDSAYFIYRLSELATKALYDKFRFTSL